MGAGSISARNIGCILMTMVSCVTIVSGASNIGHDTWLAWLLGGAVSLPLVWVYCRISALFPQKGLYDICETLLGRVAGGVVTFLMSAYALVITALTLRIFVEFTIVVGFYKTPYMVLIMAIGLVSLYLASKGMDVLGRWSFIVIVVVILNVLFTTMISYDVIQIDNILPVLNHDSGDIWYNGWMLASIGVGETVLLLACIGNIKQKESPYRAYALGILVGIASSAVILMRNVMILGPAMDEAVIFPSYTAVRVIQFGSFFERMESIISFNLVLMGITKLALCLLACSRGAGKLMRSKNPHHLLVPIFLLVLTVCSIIFKGMPEMFNFAWIYPLLALPFQVVIPIALWIVGEVKIRRIRRQQPPVGQIAQC